MALAERGPVVPHHKTIGVADADARTLKRLRNAPSRRGGDCPGGRNGGNSRNGTRSKTVLTEIGPVEIEVPRNRDGSFEPQIVRKRQRRPDGIDAIVLSLTARGLTTGEAAAHIAEVYSAKVSKDTTSRITDKVIEEMTEWANRTLHPAPDPQHLPLRQQAGLGSGDHRPVAVGTAGVHPVPELRRRDPPGTEQAALKCLYLATRSLDPTGKGRARRAMRWKPAHNTFAITIEGRIVPNTTN